MIDVVRNADLDVDGSNKACWSHAENRRRGLHNLYRIARYSLGFRSASVMSLYPTIDSRIADCPGVRELTSHPCFSAMVVLAGQRVIFERYAQDFGPDRVHSIQSITKTIVNLMIGRLVEEKCIDLSRAVSYYIPEIGSGYAQATLQQVLDMDVVNSYSEDFADPASTYFFHEEAMGWRLPRDGSSEETQKDFVARIRSAETTNRIGYAQYKDANTDVLGWVIERAGGRPLRLLIADIVDAGGLEGTFFISTDREGFPTLDGGASMTARDLARYMSLFVRRGQGVDGRFVGSSSLIETTLGRGLRLPLPLDWIRYSNHTMILKRSLGHGGWAGQYALANLDSGKVGVFLSVLENEHGISRDYIGPVIRMLDLVTSDAGC